MQNRPGRAAKRGQPFLDAIEIASEKVWAFINAILARGKELYEHKHPARNRGPVSYTHLDVYKRQALVVRNHLPQILHFFGAWPTHRPSKRSDRNIPTKDT